MAPVQGGMEIAQVMPKGHRGHTDSRCWAIKHPHAQLCRASLKETHGYILTNSVSLDISSNLPHINIQEVYSPNHSFLNPDDNPSQWFRISARFSTGGMGDWKFHSWQNSKGHHLLPPPPLNAEQSLRALQEPGNSCLKISHARFFS